MMLPGELPLRTFLKPIDRFLSHPRTTEVVCNRPGEIGVEADGKWSWHDVPEFTFDRLDQIAIGAAFMASKDFDRDNSYVGTTLPDGHRCHMVRPPGTVEGVIGMCIRKPSAEAPTMDDKGFLNLFRNTNAPVSRSKQADGILTELLRKKDYFNFFKTARRAKKTIDVCGPTGKGKTHFLKRMLAATHEDQRTVTIEGDVEFGPIGPRNRFSLLYNDQHEKMKPNVVVPVALRFRPDELWFQETRGEEAWTVLRARASGHGGGGTTWHAPEGQEIESFMLMCREYPPVQALEDAHLRRIVTQYIDIIVWCDKQPDDDFEVPRVWFKGAQDA